MAPPQEGATKGAAAASWLKHHLLTSLPYPTKTFTGQTIIVTGSNTGMGLEAARHFVRLGAGTVVLAVRSLQRGEAARDNIAKTHPDEVARGVVQVWELDLSRFESVRAFADRARAELPRLDVVVENAAKYTYTFSLDEAAESTITVNVVSTMLLALLLLPKLRETSVKFSKECVLTFTGSFVHFITKFPERNVTGKTILEGLNDEKTANMDDRYNVSKTMQLQLARELAARMTASGKAGDVVVSTLNPGFVNTEIMREADGLNARYISLMKVLLSRTAEVGGRTLVWAAYGGKDTHGAYLDNCKVSLTSQWIVSDDGMKTQRKIWDEVSAKLETIQPGVMANV